MRPLSILLTVALAAACSEGPAPKPVPVAPPPAPPAAAPVEPAKPAAGPEAPRPNPDKALAQRVKKALEGNAKLNAQGVDVTVSGGAVRLWGTVTTAAERTLAGDIAAAVPGVSSVENRLVLVAGS